MRAKVRFLAGFACLVFVCTAASADFIVVEQFGHTVQYTNDGSGSTVLRDSFGDDQMRVAVAGDGTRYLSLGGLNIRQVNPDLSVTAVFTPAGTVKGMAIRGDTMFLSEGGKVTAVDMTTWTYSSVELSLLGADTKQLAIGSSAQGNDVLMASYGATKVARWAGLATDSDYGTLADVAGWGVASNATNLFYSDRFAGKLYKANLDGSDATEFVTGLGFAPGALIDQGGELYVAGMDIAAVNVYDDSTGALLRTITLPAGSVVRDMAYVVPEPMTLTVLALGGLALLRRRRM